MTDHPVPTTNQNSWNSKPLSFRIIVSVGLAAIVTFALFVMRNPDFLDRFTGNAFKVGDCATVSADGLSGEKMEHADCATKSTASLTNPVYRVDEVKSGKDAVCAGGLSRITFSNEPENTTYCLSIAGLG